MRTSVLLLLTCLAGAESAPDKSWGNLGKTIKQSVYTVAMRDGGCVTGHIKLFHDDFLTVDSSRLDRKDVVRIGDGTSISEHDVIYSGRSSWSDLQHSEPNKYERIELDLKSHSRRICRHFSATGEQATCDGSHIERSEVYRGSYIRFAPATEWEQLAGHENVMFLAPRSWFDYALFPRMRVLLYDATLPQENVPVACKTQ